MAPNKTISANKVKKSQNTVKGIKEMALKVDTLHFYPKEEYITELWEFIYYDDKARIRKYYWDRQTHDGANQGDSYEAYYNHKGKLVYIICTSGSTCEHAHEEYWVHNGKIVDFKAELFCGCCEDTNNILSEEEVNLKRPKIGSKLIQTITWEKSLTDFLNTESLLLLLKSKDQHGHSVRSKIR